MSDRAIAKCPSCDSPALERLGDLQDSSFFAGVPTPQVLAGGALFRCGNCCLKFRFPIETDATYARLYDHDQDSIWTDAIPRPDWDLIVSYIDKFGTTGKRVMDFGCNMGGLLARLADDNEKFGVEINRAAAAIAEAKHGVTVWPSIQDIPAEQRFDVIVAVDAVEHLPSPAKLIEELSGRLGPGGCLILTTGGGSVSGQIGGTVFTRNTSHSFPGRGWNTWKSRGASSLLTISCFVTGSSAPSRALCMHSSWFFMGCFRLRTCSCATLYGACSVSRM